MPSHSADVGKLVEELIQKHQAEADGLTLSEKTKYGDSSTVSTYTWVHSMKAMSQKFVRDLLDIQTALDEQPTLSPDDARGVGKWEDAKQHGLCRCSVCKDCYIERDYITQAKWKYCPSCGSRLGNGGTDDS